ncbi:MAG: protein kinase [Planctomycetales bacterium]|nr:protein kinase [Planctomycetales bacterium]
MLTDDVEIDVIGQHLDHCEHCQSLLQRLPTIVDVGQSGTTQYASEISAELLARRSREFSRDAIPRKIGKYRIDGVLARGGMSTVYRGYHPTLQQTVAVKSLGGTRVFSEQSRRSLIDEQKTLGKIRHPSIVSVMDAELDNGIPFIVMEHVSGRNLAELVRQDGRFDLVDACAILAAVCDALISVHLSGYVHQDVKPANIMLTDDGIPKLLDLGLAIHETEESPRIGGTPRFIAPEQISGHMRPNTRSDLYAVGATLLFLVSGELPPDSRDPDYEVKVQQRVRSMPPRLRSTALNLLKHDPALRTQSITEVRDLFAEFGSSSSRINLRLAIGDVRPQRRRRSFGVVMSIIVVAMLGSISLLFSKATRWHSVKPFEHPYFVISAADTPDAPGLLSRQQAANTGKQIDTVYPRPSPKNSVWSHSGNQIACIGNDGVLRVYDVKDDRIVDVHLLCCYNDSDVDMPQICWLGDDRQILVGASIRYPLQIWDVQNQTCLYKIIPDSEVLATAWEPGLRRIAIADERGSVSVYSQDAALLRERSVIPSSPIKSIAFDPKGERLAVLGAHGVLRVISVSDLATSVEFDLATSASSVTWHPDGDRLFAGTNDGVVVEIDVSSTGNPMAHHELGRGIVASIQWNRKGDRLAVGSWDTVVWNPNLDSIDKLTQSSSYNWSTVDWHENRLLLASVDSGLTIWDADNKSETRLMESSLQQVLSIAWNPIRRQAAISTMTGNLFVIDLDGKLLWHDDPTEGNLALGSLDWSPDGSRLCGINEWQQDLFVWDAETSSLVKTHTVENGVLTAAWLNDNVILCGGTSGLLQIVELGAAESTAGLKLDGTIRDVSRNTLGTLAAVANEGSGVYIIDMAMVDAPAISKNFLEGESIRSIDWSPNSKELAVTSNDGQLRVIDAESGVARHTLKNQPLRPQVARWSNTGTAIAAGDYGIFNANGLQRNRFIPINCYAYAWTIPEGPILGGTWTDTVNCFADDSGTLAWKLILHHSGSATLIRSDGTLLSSDSEEFKVTPTH